MRVPSEVTVGLGMGTQQKYWVENTYLILSTGFPAD